MNLLGTERADAIALETFRGLLDESEDHRLRGLRHESGRVEYLCAHALLRIGLSSMYPVDPSAWRFGRDRFGRPRIEHPSVDNQPAFSLSHTASLVGCAFAPSGLVGFDVEAIDHSRCIEEVVDLAFSEAEKRAWLSLEPSSRRITRFYELWTIKESLLKAIGMGLTVAPSTLSIDMDDQQQPVIRELPAELGEPDSWAVLNVCSSPRHAGAVALGNSRFGACRIQYQEIDASTLLSSLRGTGRPARSPGRLCPGVRSISARLERLY